MAARNRERLKRSAYQDAMERVAAAAARGGPQVPEGWLEDRFVPLGFEADGAWGPSARWAFEQVCAVYAELRAPGQSGGQLAVNFGVHWRNAIAAALAQGQATVCTRSVRPGARAAERASTEACQEFHPDIG